MIVLKVSRVLSDKNCKILHGLHQVRKCTFKTTRENDMYSFYKIRYNNRYLTNFCALNQLKTFSTQPNVAHTPSEVELARNILEKSDHHCNSLAYTTTIMNDLSTEEIEQIVNKQWTIMSNIEILKNFEILSFYAFKEKIHVCDPKYEGIFEVLENRLTTFSDEDLNNLLNYIYLWENKKQLSDYKGFWRELDYECLRRSRSWDLEKTLLMNDHFYKLRLIKKSIFTYESLQNLDPIKMSSANLLHYTFLLKVNHKMPVNFEKLEYCLQKCTNEFTIDEMGIIAMTFFRYETKIKNKDFVVLLIDKLLHNIDNVSDVSLSAILKILRYSIFLEIGPHLTLLLDQLITQVPKRRLISLTHIAHFLSATLKHNKELVSQIVKRFEKEIKCARLKDIERILFTLYIFAYDPKSTPLYTLAKDEFLDPARKEELDQFPRALVYSVVYMLHMNFYPVDILKIIMHPDYIEKCTSGNLSSLNREYLVLDYNIEIECPHYDGPRLKDHIRNCLVMKYGSGSKEMKESQTAKMIMEVADICRDLLNSNSAVFIHAPLPHFVLNSVILCYDETKKQFLKPRPYFRNFLFYNVKYAPKNGKKWYALVMGTHNAISRNTYEPTGHLKAYMRQLHSIGYTPILVNYWVLRSAKYNIRKKEYIKSLLNL